jgi:hypothetical protein
MTGEALWTRLAARGLVEGERPAPGAAASPWYVRTMLGLAGWIGALFLALFVGAAFTFVMESAGAAMTLGAVFCGAALLMFAKFAGNDFVEQFALVVSLLGQVMLVVGIATALQWDGAPTYFAVAGVEAALALMVPNFLHRVLAASGAAIALALAINQLQLHGLTAPLLSAALAWIWLDAGKWATGGPLWRPIGYGLVLALLLVETFRLFDGPAMLGLTSGDAGWAVNLPLIGRAATALVLAGVAVMLARREGAGTGSRLAQVAVAAAIGLGLVSLGAPGLASALILLLLGFAAGNRLLLALGVLALLGFVSHFYYSLHATLLIKSGLLAVTGIALLAAYGLLRRAPPVETQEPAHA